MKMKFKTTYFYLKLILLLILLQFNGLVAQNYEFECFTKAEKVDVRPHFATPDHDAITIQVSNRVTHQIISRIYSIFLREVLGYEYVTIMPVPFKSYANERDQLYYSLESLIKFTHSNEAFVDKPTINLEVWMPSDHHLIPLEIHDAGAIMPPGRFGLFIPKILLDSSETNAEDIVYTMFQGNSNIRKSFRIDNDVFKIMLSLSRTNCNTEEDCDQQNVTFTPKQCSNDNDCAIVLSSYYEDTSFIISHIMELKLKIKVIWLGSNLKNAIKTLTNLYTKEKKYEGRKFIVLSWTPSEIIDGKQRYMQMTMPKCEDMISSNVTLCKYESTPILKYFGQVLRNAEDAINSLIQVTFPYESIREIIHEFEKYEDNVIDNVREGDLEIYDKDNTSSITERNTSLPTQYEFEVNDDKLSHVYNQIACGWMRNNTSTYLGWKPLPQKIEISIGGIFPISGPFASYRGIGHASLLAVKAINNNPNILKGINLDLKIHDGQCSPNIVLKTFINYYMTKDLMVGVLGPACSETVEPIAGISKHFRMAVISYSAEGASFADRNTYPYFFRTIGENRQYENVYSKLLQQFKWHRVAALTEDGQKYTEYISHMETLLKKNNIELIMNKKFPHDLTEKEMNRYLMDLKVKNSKIIIADVNDIVADIVMCEAYKLQMTARNGYVWFLPVWLAKRNLNISTNSYKNDNDLIKKSSCNDSQIFDAMNGHFSLSHAPFASDEALMQENITVREWRDKYINLLKPYNVTSSDYSGYAYDAVWVYAYALNQLITENHSYLSDLRSNKTSNRLMEIIKATDFNGVSGKIRFGETGSRFTVINVQQWINGNSKVIGHFTPNISTDYKQILGGNLFLNVTEIRWFTNDGKIPDDGAMNCALASLATILNIECETAGIILSIIICLIFIISLSTLSYIFWKRKYNHKMEVSAKYMKRFGIDILSETSLDTCPLDKWEVAKDKVIVNRRLGEGAFGTVYGGEAQISEDGWSAVAVKTLKCGSTKEDRLDFLAEAEAMKRFDHKNVVKLVGVCLESEPLYTIMEFMLYGDLKTFLLARRHLVKEKLTEDSDISPKRLTMMALDIARALSYLADQKYVHRDVACRNCMVNAQRVVKLGDFGMARPMFENDYYRFNRTGMLPVRWMSPESLALGKFTPASDVWSYAVFLYEVITFGSFPFQGLTNNEVLEHVKKGNVLKIPDGVRPQLEGLMKACWNQEYKKRPSASEVSEFISNYPRLLTPCLDIPLSSVQMAECEKDQFQFELLKKSSTRSDLEKSKTLNSIPNNNSVSTSNSLTVPNGIFLNNIRMMETESLPNGSSNAYNPVEPLLRRDSEVSKSNNSLLRYVPMCGFSKSKQVNLDNSRSISTSTFNL